MQYTDITSRALTYLLRSPHLHIDMTEAIYRGLAEMLLRPAGRSAAAPARPLEWAPLPL